MFREFGIHGQFDNQMKKSIISSHNIDNLQAQQGGVVELIPSVQSEPIFLSSGNRQELIKHLRQIPSFVDAAKKLTEGKAYQAYFPPEVLKRLRNGSIILDEKDDGLFGALIRDVETGHITNHVSLKEVMPDLIGSLSQLATQQTLTDIVNRLEVMDEKITGILQGQVNDRLAKVESGIHTYEQSIAATDPDLRRELLVNAIQNLNEGRNELLKSMDFSFLEKLPRKKLSMFFNFKLDITEHVRKNAESVCKEAHAVIEASRYIVLSYTALNQPNSLRVSLEQVESQVNAFQEKTVEIVRWLEPTSFLHNSLATISHGVLPNTRDLDTIPQRTIVVEFLPNDITPQQECNYECL